MSKHLKVAIVIMLTIIALFFLFSTLTDYNMMHDELELRKVKLQYWHKNITKHIKEGSPIPNSLYEYCSIVQRIWFVETSIVGPSCTDIESLLENPDLFNEKVEYSFYKGSDQWFLKESKGGYYSKTLLMINSQGVIYKLEEVKAGQ